MAGSTGSIELNGSGNEGDLDLWVVKIDGSGNFEVCFSKSKSINEVEVSYWIDNKRLEFMLSDTLHNFQNLFHKNLYCMH